MSKIIITGNEPLTNNIMCYFELDEQGEKKLSFRNAPYIFEVATGKHSITLNTLSPFRRGLAASGGATAGSAFLESLTDDSWNGTITLSQPNSVLLVYVESKFKTKFHLSTVKEDEVEAAILALTSHKSSRVGKKIIIIVGILLLLCLSGILINNAVSNKNVKKSTTSSDYIEVSSEKCDEQITDSVEQSPITDETSTEITEDVHELQSKSTTMYFKQECVLLDSPNGNETSYTFMKGQWAEATATSGQYTYIHTDYFTVKDKQGDDYLWESAQGWVLTSNLSSKMVEEQTDFSGKLDKNKVNELVNTYYLFCGYPYYYFDDCNRLDTEKFYEITWDDGSVATTAYAAKDITTMDDLIGVARDFCTEKMVTDVVAPDFKNGGGYYLNKDGVLYFHENYASGWQRIFIYSLTNNDDGSYNADGFLEYTDDIISFRVVNEDGCWKLDSETRK